MTVPSLDDQVETASRSKRRAWRPAALTYFIVALGLAGLTAGLYPMTAAWLSSYNQSKVIEQAGSDLSDVDPRPGEQLQLAHQYNNALTSGVKLEAGGNVPVGAGNLSNSELRYDAMLAASPDGLMARIKIPTIEVDLPVYHGTSEETLLRGAGHLEGSHLPVGGEGSRSVITAHRGLASATMFTNLDKVVEGDTFSVEVMGEVLVYQVIDIQVIEPEDTAALRAVPGEDLVTLITCTPLGINSQRIIVTGERITPTPVEDLRDQGAPPEIPGFPWWMAFGSGGVVVLGWYLRSSGFEDARRSSRVAERLSRP